MDNEYSILDRTDLVFIDPVATGFSRAVAEEKPEAFFRTKPADFESHRRIHPALGDAARTLAFAQVSLRRKLRRFPRGGFGGAFMRALRHVSQRTGSRVRRFWTLKLFPAHRAMICRFCSICQLHGDGPQFHKKLPADLQADPAKASAKRGVYTDAIAAALGQQGASLARRRRDRIVTELARLTGAFPPSHSR